MHRRYFFNGLYFASAPELAYYIWLQDHNYKFEYQPKDSTIIYHDKLGVEHKYFPDFKIISVGNQIINELHEIKGNNHFKDYDPN